MSWARFGWYPIGLDCRPLGHLELPMVLIGLAWAPNSVLLSTFGRNFHRIVRCFLHDAVRNTRVFATRLYVLALGSLLGSLGHSIRLY